MATRTPATTTTRPTSASPAARKKPGPMSSFEQFVAVANAGTPEEHRRVSDILFDATRWGRPEHPND